MFRYWRNAFCIVLLTFASASTHAATLTVDVDGGGDYENLSEAIVDATCGDTVLVAPGEYESVEISNSSGSPTKDCRGGLPLVIEAVSPAVDAWGTGPGAGDLSAACATGAMPWDVECDFAFVSYVPKFTGSPGDSIGNIQIVGFVTHYIGFSGNVAASVGCEDCIIERNFFNVHYKRCLQLADSDDAVVRGNRLYRCGGDDSGDQDIGGLRSTGQELHHNDLYGSGFPNGVGLVGTEDSPSDCLDWRDCLEDFQGTDGWTVSGADQCGFHLHHNRIHGHSGRGNNPADDGDAIDLKHLDCAADPVHIYNNEIYDNGGVAQVLFHNSARGVRFYNNVVRDGANFGIYFQYGQVCDKAKYPGMSNYRIFNNEVLRNGQDGLYVAHLTSSCSGALERPDSHDVKVFNNLFKDNVEAGLELRWITDDGVARGSGDVLDDGAWVIANNIFNGNFASQKSTGQDYQVYIWDNEASLDLEDYYTFTKNMVDGALHFREGTTGADFVDVVAFDAAGYGADNLKHAPIFENPSADDYRLVPPTIFDQGLNFADILDATDLADLPLTDRGGSPRPELKINDIGPWEFCPDLDGDGLGECIDPQVGLVNRWHVVNPTLGSGALNLTGHAFRIGMPHAMVWWQGVEPRFVHQVKVDGVVNETLADPHVYAATLGLPTGSPPPLPGAHGIAVELR